MIRLKRVYKAPSPLDGMRILVERLWPRGLSKRQVAVDLWLKDIAPMPELRRWFAHDPAKWKQFEQRYWTELENRPEALPLLRRTCRRTSVTFVYTAHDQEHNGAVALKAFLAQRTYHAATKRHPTRIRR